MDEELNKQVAEHVYGMTREAIEALPWGVPDFSGDRTWAAGVANRMLRHPKPVLTRFDAALSDAAKAWGWGWGSKPEHQGISVLLIVLTPDEICKAALKAIREKQDPQEIDVANVTAAKLAARSIPLGESFTVMQPMSCEPRPAKKERDLHPGRMLILTVNHPTLGDGRLKPIVVEALKEYLARLECDEVGNQKTDSIELPSGARLDAVAFGPDDLI
ncbi:hypothetical protein [Comamonas thiooxydans]|uniref:hypothetical protein n=1 Tax=Comamonas thiooxydans TaxID=363952 RepID=UPI00050EE892|nr:hypothetical protein [Comamonas thiooxydans]KGH29343.1 hypothetical protein P606_02260 [Comamonas thiooxydans]